MTVFASGSIVAMLRRFPDELRNVAVITTVAAHQYPTARRLLRAIDHPAVRGRITNVRPLPQSALAAYYRNCQALFLPTLLESFTATYLEAMHFGVPILTSDLGFARHVCGDAAVYFDPWNPRPIRDAILRLRSDSDLRRELATRGR
ncbi:MAG: glycosyltransferase [Planctomycetota bacterium]